ncbi:hypothetical protein VTI74DRAFT_7144 [Chaetomium olivicolor]
MAPIWGEWTEWQWDASQARWWRARQDNKGNIEYAFDSQEAPRGSTEGLTDALRNFDIGGQDQAYTQQSAYTHSSPDAAAATAYSRFSAQTPVVVSSKGKSKAAESSAKPRSKSHRDGHKDSRDKSRKHRSKPEKSYADDISGPPPAELPELQPFYPRAEDTSPSQPVSMPVCVPGSSTTAYPTHQDSAYGSSPGDERQPFYMKTGVASASGYESATGSTVQTQTGQESVYRAPQHDSGYAAPGSPTGGSSYPTQQAHSEPAYGASPSSSDYPAGVSYTTQQAPSNVTYGTSPRDLGYASGRSRASIPSYSAHQTPSQPQYGASTRDSGYGSSLSPGSGSDPRYDQRRTDRSDSDARQAGSGRHHPRGQASGPETRHSRSAPEDSSPEERGPDYYSTVTAASSVASDAQSDQLHDAISQADPYMTGAPSATYPGAESSSVPTGQTYSSCSIAADQGYSPSSSATQGYTSSAALAQSPYPMYDESGRATPKAFVQASTTAATTVADEYQYEDSAVSTAATSRQIDAHAGFVVEHSSRFQPGMVFKIVWCEPLGAAAPRTEVITNRVRMEQDGMQFYQGVRRFIVVANDEGHCACVPILTYEHKACTKKGVKPLKHGIVYQSGKRPRTVEGEPRLGFPPIAVDLFERTEKLDKESRVNYAKITTVEHNFRVFFIGRVTEADFYNVVRPAVDHCWDKKKR